VSSELLRTRVSQEFEKSLRQMMASQEFARGVPIFRQETPASGLYLIEKGSARVLLTIDEGHNQLLEVAGPGTLLGLSECVAGGHYRVTAEAVEQTTAAFVEREAFVNFLGGRDEYCMQVVHLLSDNLHALYHKFRSVSAHPGRPRRRPLGDQLS